MKLCAPSIKIVESLAATGILGMLALVLEYIRSYIERRLKQFGFNCKRIKSRAAKKRNSSLLRRFAKTHTRRQEVMFQVSGRERVRARAKKREIDYVQFCKTRQ